MPDGSTYTDFIKEVYIDSIRSVLIIDDDYPTFSEILNNPENEPAEKKKTWHSEPKKILNIIEHFRHEKRWLVDIHDGVNVGADDEIVIAEHLYQSDLLILDYQLHEHEINKGETSIKVLNKLSETPHFNMVVVHSLNDLQKTFEDVLLSFMEPSPIPLNDHVTKIMSDLLENMEDEKEEDGLADKIKKSLETPAYLHYRQNPQQLRSDVEAGHHIYNSLLRYCEDMSTANRIMLVKYCLNVHEQNLIEKKFFSEQPSFTVSWSEECAGSRWLRVGNVFVAFAHKENTPEIDLPTVLLLALENWHPIPSRLMLSKIRNELESNGVLAEDEILEDPERFAVWYRDLMGAESDSVRYSEIKSTLHRHGIDLIHQIEEPVIEFTNRLVTFETNIEKCPKCIVLARFNIDLDNKETLAKSLSKHNAYVCSHQPTGWHLKNGHILNFDDDFWVCLSPACDLVPNQKTGGHFGEVKGHMPFFAVKLYPVKKALLADEVNSNRFLFLEIEGDVKIFSFNSSRDENSNPHWYPLYASNNGELSKDDMSVSVLKSVWCKDTKTLKYESFEAVIVQQLYSENAINLTQKLGQNFNRVGLDYKVG